MSLLNELEIERDAARTELAALRKTNAELAEALTAVLNSDVVQSVPYMHYSEALDDARALLARIAKEGDGK